MRPSILRSQHPLPWLFGMLAGASVLAGVLALGADADDPAGGNVDAVSHWTDIAFDAGATLDRGTTQAREMAMTHIAIHDALNGIRPRFASYTHGPRASADASAGAAIGTVLDATVPSQVEVVGRAYADALARVPDGQAKRDGVAAGDAAAHRVLASRVNDGAFRADVAYHVHPGIGIWEPTPPAHRRALLPDWAKLKPFLLDDPAQVLPPPPPALTSARYARDYAETASLGGEDSTARTAQQTATARFWAGNVVGSWNEIARNTVRDRNADPDRAATSTPGRRRACTPSSTPRCPTASSPAGMRSTATAPGAR